MIKECLAKLKAGIKDYEQKTGEVLIALESRKLLQVTIVTIELPPTLVYLRFG